VTVGIIPLQGIIAKIYEPGVIISVVKIQTQNDILISQKKRLVQVFKQYTNPNSIIKKLFYLLGVANGFWTGFPALPP
jgi:hypothetical protein